MGGNQEKEKEKGKKERKKKKRGIKKPKHMEGCIPSSMSKRASVAAAPVKASGALDVSAAKRRRHKRDKPAVCPCRLGSKDA